MAPVLRASRAASISLICWVMLPRAALAAGLVVVGGGVMFGGGASGKMGGGVVPVLRASMAASISLICSVILPRAALAAGLVLPGGGGSGVLGGGNDRPEGNHSATNTPNATSPRSKHTLSLIHISEPTRPY